METNNESSSVTNSAESNVEKEGVGLVSALSVGTGNEAIPKNDIEFIAGIVFGESSILMPVSPADSNTFASSRKWIAEIAYRRKEKNYQNFPAKLATSQRPTADSLKNPNSKATWENCKTAQTDGSSSFTEKKKTNKDQNVLHFFMWPSIDGETPREKKEKEIADDWPFEHTDKITALFGPFKNPINSAHLPSGSDIYIFIYDGVS